ncbi:hypothetical protein EDD86DRAFT_248541 [Gorgonomyces haynaldii]|nr:hypothetical protein EDD86DRAFT_248541 [Gorgonomyces haynaldii]
MQTIAQFDLDQKDNRFKGTYTSTLEGYLTQEEFQAIEHKLSQAVSHTIPILIRFFILLPVLGAEIWVLVKYSTNIVLVCVPFLILFPLAFLVGRWLHLKHYDTAKIKLGRLQVDLTVKYIERGISFECLDLELEDNKRHLRMLVQTHLGQTPPVVISNARPWYHVDPDAIELHPSQPIT